MDASIRPHISALALPSLQSVTGMQVFAVLEYLHTSLVTVEQEAAVVAAVQLAGVSKQEGLRIHLRPRL